MRTQIGMDYFEYKVLPENPTVHNTYTVSSHKCDRQYNIYTHISFVSMAVLYVQRG